MKDREFKRLQKKCYDELKRKGFKDIERTRDNEKETKGQYADAQWCDLTPEEYIGVYSHSLKLGEYLHHYPHWKPEERRVFELHLDGLSNAKIRKATKVSEHHIKRIINSSLEQAKTFILEDVRRDDQEIVDALVKNILFLHDEGKSPEQIDEELGFNFPDTSKRVLLKFSKLPNASPPHGTKE